MIVEWLPAYDESYLEKQITWISNLIRGLPKTSAPRLFIDIGAQEGSILKAITDNMLAGDRAWAFEPNKQSVDHLNSVFSGDLRVTVFQSAVSDYIGKGKIYIHKIIDRAGSCFLNQSSYKQDMTQYDELICDVTTLDALELPTTVDIPFIKIDAEGHDFLIIRGGAEMIKKHRPFIMFEWSGMLGCESFGYKPIDVYRFFKEHDYSLRSLVKGHDDRYIYMHFNTSVDELHDIVAIPNEKLI